MTPARETPASRLTPAALVQPGEWRPGVNERRLRSLSGAAYWFGMVAVVLVQSFVPKVAPADAGFWRPIIVLPSIALGFLNLLVLPRVPDRRLQIWTELNIIPALLLNVVLLQITTATALVLLNVILALIYAGFFFRLPVLAVSVGGACAVALSALFTDPASQAPHLAAFLAVYLPTVLVTPFLLHLQNNETLAALDAARFRALSDPVTGLANLRALEDEAERELAAASDDADGLLALLLVDIDNFKSANAKFGHIGGDHALRSVAEQLSRIAPRDALVARIGGDGFAVLMRGESKQRIVEAGEMLRAAVRAASAVMDLPGVDFDASVGVATYPEDGTDLEQLFDAADKSMYAVKGTKRHTVPNLEAAPQEPQERPSWVDVTETPPPRAHRTLTFDLVTGGRHRFLGSRTLYARMSALDWSVGSLAIALSLLMPDAYHGTFTKWWLALLVGAVMTVGSLVTNVKQHSPAHVFFDYSALIGIGVVVAITGGFASPAALLLILLVVSQSWFWRTEQLAPRMIGPALIALAPIAYQSIGDAPQGLISAVTVGGLAALLVTLVLSMYIDRTVLNDLEQRAEELALIDPLTEIPNRRAFDAHVQDLLDPEVPTERFAIVMLDLDNFKHVNAADGHRAGDRLLQAVAARLDNATRRDDLIARVGGDEFAAVLTGVGVDAARSLAERFVESIAETPEARAAGVGASAGFALYPVHGRTLDELVFTADSALMTVKASGKGATRVARIVSAVN